MDQNPLAVLDSDLRFSPSTPVADRDAAIKECRTSLSKLSAETIANAINNPVETLNGLDPAKNSITYAALLEAALNQTSCTNELLEKLIVFFSSFDLYQIRYAGQSYRSIVNFVLDTASLPNHVKVSILTTAILRVDPQGATFTSTHLILAKLAYEANATDQALDVLNKDIVFFASNPPLKSSIVLCDPSLSPSVYLPVAHLSDTIRYSDILEYNYICGLVQLSRKDWRRAKQAFERVIVHPVKDKTVSKIMVDAHCRWILSGLLADGRAPALASTAGSVRNAFQILSKPYQDLAGLFVKNEALKLKSTIEEHAEKWLGDDTKCLIEAVRDAYQQWQILRLKQVYQYVSVSSIRQSTLSGHTGEPCSSDEEVLALIKEMIASNMISGDLEMGQDASTTYLVFRPEQSGISESEFAREIAGSKLRIEVLSDQFQTVNSRLGRNPDYLKYLAKEQARSEKDQAGPAGFDPEIEEDEDLMTDVVSNH